MSEGLVSKFDVLLDAYCYARKNRKQVRAVPKGTSRKKREKLETSLSTEVGLTALDAETSSDAARTACTCEAKESFAQVDPAGMNLEPCPT